MPAVAVSPMTTWAMGAFVPAVVRVVIIMVIMAVRAVPLMTTRAALGRVSVDFVVDDNRRATLVRGGGSAHPAYVSNAGWASRHQKTIAVLVLIVHLRMAIGVLRCQSAPTLAGTSMVCVENNGIVATRDPHRLHC